MFTPRSLVPLRRILFACGVFLLGLSSADAQVAISTLAGSSPAIAPGNIEGIGTAARFNALASVAVDSAGNIYVADAGNHTIRKVTAAGVVTTLAGSGAAGAANGTGAAASFRFPQGVATDNTNVYVADTFNHAIRKIVISTGVVTTLAGTVGTSGSANGTGVAATFNTPLGLAVSGTDLYVADTSNHTIRKIVIGTGVVTTFAGTAGTSGFADATGVAATFKNPGAIAADGTTNLYVADTANHTIRKIVIGTAAVSTLAGTGNGTGASVDSTGASASFKLPGGLVVSGANLFVADTGNNTIRQIVHATGVVTTIAGSAGAIGTTDAIGTAARFQGPTGIGVSAGGILYIADTNNHTLRTGIAATAPTVTNPAAATVAVGANPTFDVTTTGNPTPTIQWERQAANTTGFAAISASATYTGVGTATLTVTNATLAMSGDQFRASVSNGVGAAVVSAIPAALTVQLAPTISSAAAANFSVNTAGTFTVTATGSPAPTFTVSAGTFPSWVALNSTTGVISGTPTNTTGSPFNFIIRASNGVGTVSNQAFVLTVQGTPVITAISAPRQVVTLAQNLTLSVTATSGTAQTYQWKRNGLPISGATNATYAITAAVPVRDNGWYQVVVTNDFGSTTSAVVFVNVAVSPAQVLGIGENNSGQTTIPSGLSGVGAVYAAGGAGYHSLALKSDGTVVAWGSNSAGQTTIPSGLTGVVAVAGGSNHSLALKSDGTVVAWGNNSAGQTTTPSGLTGVVAVAGGGNQSLALKSDGTVVAWGQNNTIPSGLSGVVAIAGGGIHSLALKSDGTVVAWGSNDSGQTTVPSGLSAVVAVAGGYNHSLALKSDGTVVAWGHNGYGQTTIPSGLTGVVAVAGGSNHSLALKSDGTVVAWGNNYNDQTTIPSGLGLVVAIAAGGSHSLFLRNAAGDLAPVITTPPASISANPDDKVTLSVVASGSTPLNTYQWRKGGTVISGATATTYTISEITSDSVGSYDVVVTNYLGTVTSVAATISVNTAPVVSTTHRSRHILALGQMLTLTLDAAINAAAAVQWRRNGLPLSGASARTLSVSTSA